MTKLSLNEQLQPEHKKILEKQAYRIVGNHSAVKICEWTNKNIRNEGICYKCTFYGIRSHQCLQMTTSMFCASRCKFCWRGKKSPVAKEWYGSIDQPEHIINHAIDAHLQLLIGHKGNPKANKNIYQESRDVKHVALSLTGEPITYPLINQILKAFHKRKISTFLVTNSQYPEEIKLIDKVTQLYLSIDAPNKQLLKEIDRPLFPDFWERTLECLKILATRKYRTCIRLTAIKNINMTDIEGYSSLIKIGNPTFIEIKGYVNVGASKEELSYESMPRPEEVELFAKELLKHLPNYKLIQAHKPSRAVLIARKDFAKKQWINFHAFFDGVNKSKDITAEEYSSEKMELN